MTSPELFRAAWLSHVTGGAHAGEVLSASQVAHENLLRGLCAALKIPHILIDSDRSR